MRPLLQLVPQHACPDAPHAVQVLALEQSSPMLQSVPQQACVLAPQATHLPVEVEHRLPAAHTDPAQQGWFAPPQVPHAPLLQVSPATLHMVPVVQHGSPLPPHEAQRPAAHTVVVSVQLLPQHVWFSAPHAAHCPFMSQMDPA